VRKYKQEIEYANGFQEILEEKDKKYKFVLQTLMVLDDENEGFPVAFASSYRQDSVLIDVFLSTVKERVGTLSPHTLVTDMVDSYYNSWMKIMTPPVHRSFCT